MLKNLVITKLLYLLEKISYRTKFGLSLADELKYWYYNKSYWHDKCLCGGKIITISYIRYEDDVS
jgi:hypothetical protein